MTRTRLLCQKERVHRTGLHRLLDSTAGMVSMTRTRLLCQKEMGLKKQREHTRSWASEGYGYGRGRVRARARVRVRFVPSSVRRPDGVDRGLPVRVRVMVTVRARARVRTTF